MTAGRATDGGRAGFPAAAGPAARARAATVPPAPAVALAVLPDAAGGESVVDWVGFQPNATSVSAGLFTWEIATGEVLCEPVTYRLHGLPEDTTANMDTFLSRVPEEDLPSVVEAMSQMVAACGTYQIEYRVRGEDGSLRWMEARGRMLAGPDGKPARMVGVVMDTTAVQAKRGAEGRRLRQGVDRAMRTYEFTAALASASSVEAIIAAACEGLRAYGADSLVMVAVEAKRLAVVASIGFDRCILDALTVADQAVPTPILDAISWRSAVVLPSAAAFAANYPQLANVAAWSARQAWVALPVTHSRDSVGACLIGFPEAREPSAEERALMYGASSILAQSLIRARMFETEHALATELQHGLLPRGPFSAPGVAIATRYQPATSGMEIGGDFYDAFKLPGGRVALVIGDVQGHNVIAASLMGRLRTAVQAYAREGHGPAEVMAAANRWLVGLNTDPDISLFATCCFVVLDPATGALAVCRAGHPPPVLVTPGAAPQTLHCDSGMPLGIEAQVPYEAVEFTVPPGTVLLLTTDGLLETDGDDTDYNVRCMLDVLGRGTEVDLETLADEVLGSPRRPPRHGDDVALLLARLNGRLATP